MKTQAFMGPPEAVVHRQVCDYIRHKYPDVIFNSDGAGNALSPAQAGMAKMLRSAAGFPDLFLAIARGKFHGLFIEIKREGVRLYLKSGVLSTDAHIQAQAEVLNKLIDAGYYAAFGQGTEATIEIIDRYMALPAVLT